jgi:hypothetical protein
LRPDTIVPAPDITSAEAAAIESLEEFVADEAAVAAESEEAADTTVATQTSAPAVLDEAASSESIDEEKQDASPDAAN